MNLIKTAISEKVPSKLSPEFMLEVLLHSVKFLGNSVLIIIVIIII
jgi:hypothetical protein